jgi:DNA repair protein RecN (Recombination protein N)
VSELDELAPRVGQEADLATEALRLARASERGAVLLDAAWSLADGDGAVQETCARLARLLRELDCGDGAVVERLMALCIEASDLGRTCGALGAGAEPDPEREALVSERLDRYRTLARRHRVAPDGLEALHAALAGERDGLEQAGDPRAALERQREALERDLGRLGPPLRAARLAAARKLEREVRGALEELRMERARFEAAPGGEPQAQEPAAWTEGGPGAGRFLVSVNPGEDLQGLERVASGGETARIHLALRGALAGHHRIPILVFDEIDAGIGGRVGLPFGRRLGALARHHQVLVVTHLPQVAAFASRHFRVHKAVRGGRTRTTIDELDAEARVLELAEMLGGDVAPQAARTQAEALMREAGA